MKSQDRVETELSALISERAKGLSRPIVQHDDVLQGALDLIRHQQHCLNMAAQRFEDMGAIVRAGTPYDNFGFFDASARRCRQLDF